MPRNDTAPRTTTLNDSSIDAEQYSKAHPLFRKELDRAMGRKRVLRLLAIYLLFCLPLHSALCWLASRSIFAAVTVVAVLAGISIALAVAKWLDLEAALQFVPFVVVVALFLVGCSYFANRSWSDWWSSVTSSLRC